MNRDQQLSFVERTLNTCLIIGLTPPKTCSGLVKLFDDRVSTETLLSFFQQNQVKWVMAAGSAESYEEYNMKMNECAALYMSR